MTAIKKFTYILLSMSMILMAGCSKELNLEPKDKISKDALSENDIDKLRIGLYARMENQVFAAAFDFDIKGENYKGGPAYSLVDPVNTSPSDATIANLWQSNYITLSKINFLIQTIDNLGTQASKTELAAKGQALYFRALIYYNMVARWGGVPIVLTPTYENIPRATENEVWEQIKTDLIAAEPLLADITDRFYVSKQADQALLARVYLATADHANAITYADKVLANTQFQLGTDAIAYSSMFVSGSTSKELIFALANNTASSPHLYYANLNDVDGSWQYSPSDNVYSSLYADDAIRKGDKRKTAVFSGDATRVIKFPNGKAGQQLVAPAVANYTPIIISRISEIYLIKAEAQGASSAEQTLLPYFSARYQTPPPTGSISGMNPTDFQTMILDERRREFYAEGQRWFDIKRTGRKDLLSTLAGRDYLLYYPIPQNEVDLAGYTQNPGY